jgi:hypothetical protein
MPAEELRQVLPLEISNQFTLLKAWEVVALLTIINYTATILTVSNWVLELVGEVELQQPVILHL